ncbi:hypothetical protein ES895_23185 [Bacillus sp. 007/AIA-02/001]|nr:hypothetical protein ES895_23185 [Bacillus sp. 007/AIA-02/001]
MDGSPIHIIKIKVVQVGRHLRVSFFITIRHNMTIYRLTVCYDSLGNLTFYTSEDIYFEK